MKIDKLHYITNGKTAAEIYDEVEAVLNAGCKWLQLRIKNGGLDFLEIAGKVKTQCEGRAVMIVNDRVDIANSIQADGVHLGLEDMPVAEARAILGEDKIIGGTANTLEDCLERQKNGVDYIGLGPYRNTSTKSKLSPLLGLEGYEKIVPKSGEGLNVPVVAIGGIVLDDISTIKEKTNVHGIAVSGLIAKSTRKSEMIRAIYKELN